MVRSKHLVLVLIINVMVFLFPVLAMALTEEDLKSTTRWSPLELAYYSPQQLAGSDRNIYGLRLSLLYSKNRDMSGLDIGFGKNEADDVNGIQIALIGLNEAENANGVQIAVIGNFSEKMMKGDRGNYTRDYKSMKGIQIAGFGNKADNIIGIQAAGLFNGAHNAIGLQIGFLSNVATTLKGIQVSAFNVNYSTDTRVQGAQFGFFNSVTNVQGCQIGAFNSCEHLRGVQIGIGNECCGKMKGVQIGIVNNCHELTGVQIGLWNTKGPKYSTRWPIINAHF